MKDQLSPKAENKRYIEEIKPKVEPIVNPIQKEQLIPKLSPREAPKDGDSGFSYEDLMECLEDIIISIEVLIERAQKAENMLQLEIRSITTFKHHDYEGIIKFMVYKLTHELTCLLSLFSHVRFAKHLKTLPEEKEFIRRYVNEFSALREKQAAYNIPQIGSTIRIYTSCPKEIKINDFLMQKLAEMRGA